MKVFFDQGYPVQDFYLRRVKRLVDENLTQIEKSHLIRMFSFNSINVIAHNEIAVCRKEQRKIIFGNFKRKFQIIL